MTIKLHVAQALFTRTCNLISIFLKSHVSVISLIFLLKFYLTANFFKKTTIFQLIQNETLVFSNHKRLIFKKTDVNKNFFYKIFFILNFKTTNYFFLPHHSFYVENVIKFKHHQILNPLMFEMQWKQGLFLLINVFYTSQCCLIFGTELFKKETLAFNWYWNNKGNDLWKLAFKYFFFKTIQINSITDSFFLKLKNNFDVDCVFIYDSYYHFKTLYYLNKYQFFTIGFSHPRTNPWVFSYYFSVFNDSFLTHSLSFYLINYANKIAVNEKFYLYKNLWKLNCQFYFEMKI